MNAKSLIYRCLSRVSQHSDFAVIAMWFISSLTYSILVLNSVRPGLAFNVPLVGLLIDMLVTMTMLIRNQDSKIKSSALFHKVVFILGGRF